MSNSFPPLAANPDSCSFLPPSSGRNGANRVIKELRERLAQTTGGATESLIDCDQHQEPTARALSTGLAPGGYAASAVGSPRKACQSSDSSRRIWLTLPKEMPNLSATS